MCLIAIDKAIANNLYNDTYHRRLNQGSNWYYSIFIFLYTSQDTHTFCYLFGLDRGNFRYIRLVHFSNERKRLHFHVEPFRYDRWLTRLRVRASYIVKTPISGNVLLAVQSAEMAEYSCSCSRVRARTRAYRTDRRRVCALF